MRYLTLMIFVSVCGLMTPAVGQTSFNGLCCPPGCVPSFNPDRCIYTGTSRTCYSGVCPANRNPRHPQVPPSFTPCVNCIPRPWVDFAF
jgi:hypothetical protein